MKCLHINILSQILSVFDNGNKFENNLGHQVFGVFYNNPKCAGIPT